MKFVKKIDELLKKEMTENGYLLWHKMFEKIPPVWDRLSSSSKKYHKKDNGEVQTISEHTYEMLYAGNIIIRMFGYEKNCVEKDTILLSIVLHDAFKYGENINSIHTSNKHDKLAADKMLKNKKILESKIGESQYSILEEAIRYHSGRWSSDVSKKEQFKFNEFNPETMFVHMLDMLSTKNVLKAPE